MIRAALPSEPLSNRDFKRLCAALLVALDALARNGDQEAVDLVSAVLDGRATVEEG